MNSMGLMPGRRILVGSLVAWVALAAVFALHEYASGSADLTPVPLVIAVYWSASEWMPWALLTPLVLIVTYRAPLLGSSWGARVGLYAALGVGLSVLHAFLQAGADAVVVSLTHDVDTSIRHWLSGRRVQLPADFTYLLQRKMGFSLAVFAAVVGAAHGAHYYELSQQRELDAARLRAEVANARLAALTQRLRPHFLFNTLNGIAELITEDPDRAEHLLTELAHLLRSALESDEKPTVSLLDELTLTRSYLEIQRLRFGDRLRTHMSFDATLASVRVPPLFLQSAIENAVRFAVNTKADVADVSIDVRGDAAGFTVLVSDSGPGPGAGPLVEGTGLRSTRARLTALYGDRFHLAIEQRPEGGGQVRFELPIIRRD